MMLVATDTLPLFIVMKRFYTTNKKAAVPFVVLTWRLIRRTWITITPLAPFAGSCVPLVM